MLPATPKNNNETTEKKKEKHLVTNILASGKTDYPL